MKVWIDIVTPKHALFFEPFYRELHGDNQGRSRLIDAQLSLALGHSTEAGIKI